MLSESKERFSKAFYAAPISMAICTIEEGRLLEVNEAFERLTGYTPDEAIGRTALELGFWQDPLERQEIVALLEREGEVRDREFTLRDRRGELRSALFSGVVINLHGEKRLLSLVNDITERKRAEEGLRESEERYRRIVETAREGILVSDATAVTTYVNLRMADILGYFEGEMLGRSLFDFIESSCREEVLNQFEQRKKGKKDRYEAVMLRKNGEKIWVTISGSPTFDQKGAFAGSFAMISDITARKQAEEKIEILNTNLAARAAELEAANRELEAFNYTVSHDLRAPLTNITCCTQAIQTLWGDILNIQCHDLIRIIDKQTLRMDQIITILLNFSRVARSEMSRETVDLTSLAQVVAAQLKMNEPHRRVMLTIAEDLKAQGDAKLLRSVLENLIGNAWKYTGKRETALIEFGVAEHDGTPAYFVCDNGSGFDMSHADRLFRPFERLPSAEECKGFGIGLATVERIISRHGGKVWAEGEPGKGAIFYFTL